MPAYEMDFVLAGPNAGRTVALDGKRFINGVAHVRIAAPTRPVVDGLVRKLALGYNAHPKGSEALLRAEADWAKRKTDGGLRRVSKAEKHGDVAGPVRRDSVREQAPHASGSAPVHGSGHDDSAGDGNSLQRGAEQRSEGSAARPGDSGAPVKSAAASIDAALRKALEGLDPEVDAHWVATGKNAGRPRLDALVQATGDQGITREDVEAAWPGLTREKLKAMRDI